MKKLILGSLFAAAVGAAALPAGAHPNVRIALGFGVPTPLYEVVPAPRMGWAWVPGAWVVRHRYYHWVPGHWARRPAVAYVPARAYAPVRWYYYR